MYGIDADAIPKTCHNKTFTNLKDATTFVFPEGNKNPIRLDGFISSKKLLKFLSCTSRPSQPIKEKSYRIQIVAFNDCDLFEKFIQRDLDFEKLNLQKYKEEAYVQVEDNFFKVYLGSFKERSMAQAELSILEKILNS